MTSFLTRAGSLESRLASQTIWSSGKRKRVDWVCAECKARRALRQRRAYGDSSLKVTPDQYLFPPRGLQNEEKEERTPTRRASWRKGTLQWTPWGFGTQGDEPKPQEAPAGQGDAALSDDQRQSALWEGFERAEEATEEQPQERTFTYAADTSWEASTDVSLLDIDYASALSQALANNEPDMVARCLYAAERKNDLDFIRSIPRTTFAECIRILQPSNFIAPLATAHMEMSEAIAKQLGFSPIQQVAWQHAKVLRDVLGIRRFAGAEVSLTEYKMLLRSARDLCNKDTANRIWHFLLSDGLTPDTDCYNCMMAANVWNGIFRSEPRQKVRVIPFFQLARQARRPSIAFANYRVGNGGLKEQVMHVFSDMLKHGAIANEESFRNVIMAAAREGDLATVKSILRKVWDIDVGALVGGKDEATILPKPMDPNSPLRPTSKLLFALAHAFGVNNDIPTALRLVDFVARRYEISIDLEVWKQLFEWTFVLALPRTGIKSRTDGTRTGNLPKQSVLSLWETMTGPPYFIEPTPGMYNHLIKNLQDRDSLPALYEKMCEGRELYNESMERAHRAFKKLKRTADSEDQLPGTSLETLRREWEYLDLIRKRNLFWCKRWLRLLLATLRSFNRVDKHQDWALREVPRILWEWRHFAPTLVRYDTAGGVVELKTRTKEEIEENRTSWEERQKMRISVLEKAPFFTSEDWVRPRLPTSWSARRMRRKAVDGRQREDSGQ